MLKTPGKTGLFLTFRAGIITTFSPVFTLRDGNIPHFLTGLAQPRLKPGGNEEGLGKNQQCRGWRKGVF